MKIVLTYAYNGAKFNGLQTQPHKNTVEDALNLALSHVGIYESVISSSRTDKGVHALRQKSTTHCGDFWDLDKLKNMLNRHAAPNIYIREIKQVDESFQVRFDAKARLYSYILSHDKFSPFLADFVLFHPKVDMLRLNECLSVFKGEHDFNAYKKNGTPNNSTIRTIYFAKAYRYKNCTIINIKANGFLRAQIRFMVANVLKALNDDKIELFKELFKEGKALTKIPIAPNGLYLREVFY